MLSDNTNIEVSNKKLKKILFIYNAIEDGWKVEKKMVPIYSKKNMKIAKRFLQIHI